MQSYTRYKHTGHTYNNTHTIIVCHLGF